MRGARRIIEPMLAKAGVTVNGDAPWDIQVHDERLFGRVLRHKNLGLGEGYMDGWWDCERVDEFIRRVLAARLDGALRPGLGLMLRALPAVVANLQTRRGAGVVARRHYDLGNDLFTAFLDGRQQYSCAYFAREENLDEAQRDKLRLIGEKLDLRPGDRVLDIGCGWGGLARWAAERRGCEVTAVNISGEQCAFAEDACAGLPVTVVRRDYRDLDGEYDKIVSVGMFEHVGEKNHRTFMHNAARLISRGGRFLLHTIGCNETAPGCDPWITKYIFPRGSLPSLAQIARAAEGLFVIEDVHNIGPHYDRTLMAWHRRFQDAWPALAGRYGPTFKRMWDYYLLSCAGAFRARAIQLWQVLMTPEGAPQPDFGRDHPPRGAALQK